MAGFGFAGRTPMQLSGRCVRSLVFRTSAFHGDHLPSCFRCDDCSHVEYRNFDQTELVHVEM